MSSLFTSRSLGITLRTRLLLWGGVLLVGLLFAIPSTFAVTYTVNSTNSVNDGTCDGTHCSLLEAVTAANLDGAGDTIVFSITGPISVAAPGTLPTITTPMDIDGNNAGITLDGNGESIMTASTASGNVTVRGLTFHNSNTSTSPDVFLNWTGTGSMSIGGIDATDRMIFTNAGPKTGLFIRIAGSNTTLDNVYLGLSSDGATLRGAQSNILLNGANTTTVIKNSIITDASECGIRILAVSGILEIAGNTIGLKADGSTAGGNLNGICDDNGTSSPATITIGGSTAADRNIISGNTRGILLNGDYSGSFTVRGNYIGLNTAGTAAVANATGVEIGSSVCSALGNCVIRSNTVSGNSQNGVLFTSGASNWYMIGNTIGTNPAGTAAIANVTGVNITGTATNIYVGQTGNLGTDPNIISGNTGPGVYLENATGATIKISSNYIGLTADGDSALGNGSHGIDIKGGSAGVTIGDSTAGARTNVISANTGAGIIARDSYSGTLSVYGSIFGLNLAETADRGNTQAGIDLANNGGATGTVTIGSTLTPVGNIIAGNSGDGIFSNGGSNETYQGNTIGMSSTGTVFKNDGRGIRIESTSATGGPMIGGTVTGQGNVIVGQTASGPTNNEQVLIANSTISGTKIFGNYFGVNTAFAIKGGDYGIGDFGTNTSIGSATGSGANTFGGGTQNAMLLMGSGTVVVNNYIGISSTGVNISNNTQKGISIVNAASNITIGGSGAGERNYISNCNSDGIGTNSASNVYILGNYIGVDTTGTADRGNTGDGIEIQNASNIFIGRNNATPVVYAGNVISGNTVHGIFLGGTSAITTVNIQANTIGLNAAKASKISNDGDGIRVTKGTGVIIGGTTSSDSNVISGNGGAGLSLRNGVTGEIVQRNYIGTTSNGLNVDVGNTQGGIRIQGGASSNVIGNVASGSGTPGTDPLNGNGNILGYNGTADIILDGATTVNNSLRSNVFNHSATDTSVNISFANSPQNGATLESPNTNATTFNTSRFAITTDFANGTLMDVYSYKASGTVYTTTYEGTATVSSGFDQLDRDFTGVAGDLVYFQLTEADGDSTQLSPNFTMTADTTAPGAPTVTSSQYSTSASYTFTGTKEAYTGIVQGSISNVWVAVDSSTTWSYTSNIPNEGANTINLYEVDNSQNLSSAISFTVTRDTVLPPAPGITSPTQVIATTPTLLYTINGVKEADAVITYGDIDVASGSSTTFGFNVTLVPGQNTLSNIKQRDLAGNLSSGTTFVIDYIQLGSTATGGGGGSGGGGGAGSSSSSTSTEAEESSEEETSTEEVEEEAQAGESEEESEEGGESVSGEEEVSAEETHEEAEEEEVEEVVEEAGTEEAEGSNGSAADVETTTPSVTSQPTVPPQPHVTPPKNPYTQSQPSSSFVQDVESLYPTASDSASQEPSTSPEVQPQNAQNHPVPPYPSVPGWKPAVSRETLLENPFYMPHAPDKNENKIPDWWEHKHLGGPVPATYDPTVADTDDDGLSDAEEYAINSDPNNDDSDNDGLSDEAETDAGTDPNATDSDEDGLTDVQEVGTGTDPNSSDTDGDGTADSVELNWGSDPWDSENAPVSMLGGGGVPDIWLEIYGLEEEAVSETVFVPELGPNVKIEKTLKSSDTDKDGLSDYDELLNNTSPLQADTDNDGQSDGAEVHIYKTNPTLLTPSSEFFKLRLSNVAFRFKTTYLDDQPVFFGSSMPRSTVEWFLVPMEAELAASVSSSLMPSIPMYVSLFDADSDETVSGSLTTDESGKFLIRPDGDLEDGTYALLVRSLDEDGNVSEETLPYELSIDTSGDGDWVEPKQLDEVKIDLEALSLIQVESIQPYLYGVAKDKYEVVAAWQSELYASSLVVDTTAGEFVTAAPQALEDGVHDLYVYAYDPESNYYSSVVNIDFEVIAGQLYSSATQPGAYERLLLFVAAAAGGFFVFLFWSHRRRKNAGEAALQGEDPS